MKIKKGVNIQGIDIRIRPVLIASEAIWKKHGKEVVVTGGMEGEHSAGSFHYYGLALDLRIHYFTKTEKNDVFQELKRGLGSSFDVVLHRTHIHVEYQQ